ncbi:ABC transporter permease [Oceanivirga salmonicida]|uniref:ABC transporter permease n=1 Tax=Oceanivirga salmonicida TaxID=1769291 RepID=UPI00082A87E1|nr:ABC transporter permease [Oceanivirga salmonicida]
MEALIVFIKVLPESIKLGLIYSIMVMGVYITYKILDFPDLSVDGTFPLGGFLFAYISINYNFHPFIGILFAFIGGIIAGYITGLLHIKFGIDKLLSGILTMTALYSINARILGKPNAFLESNQSWFYIIDYANYFKLFTIITVVLLIIKLFYDKRIKPNKNAFISFAIYVVIYILSLIYIIKFKDINMYLLLIIVFIIKLIMDYILTSKIGFILRALGDNETLVSDLGVSVENIKLFGLMLSNGLVSISGALFAQYIRIIDLSSSVGTIIIGLASIIFGLGLVKRTRTINYISIIIVGSIIYYIVINFALNSQSLTSGIYQSLGLSIETINRLTIKPTDVKIITALFLAIILGIGYKKRGKNA